MVYAAVHDFKPMESFHPSVKPREVPAGFVVGRQLVRISIPANSVERIPARNAPHH